MWIVDHCQWIGIPSPEPSNSLNLVRGCDFSVSGSVVLMAAGHSRRIHRRQSSLSVACTNDCRHIGSGTILLVRSSVWRHVRSCVWHDWLCIDERPQTARVWTCTPPGNHRLYNALDIPVHGLRVWGDCKCFSSRGFAAWSGLWPQQMVLKSREGRFPTVP